MSMWKEYHHFLILMCTCIIWSEPSEDSTEQIRHDSAHVNESSIKSTELNEYDELKAEIDSLRGVKESLKKEARSMNRDEDGNNIHSDSDVRKTIREIKDTIQILTKEGAQSFLGSFMGRKRNTRERGFGGGLGPVIGLYTITTKPIERLINTVPRLSNFRATLDGPFEHFVLMGGMGYGAVGNGLRIGGGGRGGSKSFSIFTNNDTAHTLEISLGFGGFLLEKCFVANKLNIFLGGMAGGGGIDVTDFKTGGIMVNITMSDIADHELKENNSFSAGFMLLEVHGGFTYTLIPWLHMGLDISMPFFISPSGFKSKADISVGEGFMTINPGLRIRIMFGNIG